MRSFLTSAALFTAQTSYALELELEGRVTDPSEVGYFRTDDYQAMSASEKLDILWEQIEADTSVQDYMWSTHDDQFTQNAKASMSYTSDDMRSGREKHAHTQGVVAKVRWVSTGDHEYTGMYAEGGDYGILRASETGFITELSAGLHPSIAVKILRDGWESTNLFGMANFTGSDSFDFFKNPLKNRVEAFDESEDYYLTQTIQKKLAEAWTAIFVCGLAEPGMYSIAGDEVTAPVTPWEIEFRAAINSADYGITDEREYDADGNEVLFYTQLQRIPAGTTLYEVWATNLPDEIDGVAVETKKIADIVMDTAFTTSYFGDSRLFFQHLTPMHDYQNNSGWRRYDTHIDDSEEMLWDSDATIALPDDEDQAKSIIMEGISEYGCPFAWLLGLVSVE